MSEGLVKVLGLLLAIAVPLASFATGLRATDPLWLWKRPRLLSRALLAILVVVPLAGVLLAEVLSPGNPFVRAGLVVSILSVGIGPPALLKHAEDPKELAAYEIGLNVALMTVAVVYMPLAVGLHGAFFHHDVSLPWSMVARVVLLKALLPIFAGIVVARMLPKLAERLNRYAPKVVGVTMLAVALLAIVAVWRALIALGLSAWLTCATVAIVAILIGHFAGGPGRETRAVLAEFSAVRFPALAVLLASIVPQGKGMIPTVIAYVICSSLLVGVYRAAGRPASADVEVRT